jgi:8-hydroxy-5-deazaflavin:NADPH oxidoreductase
MKIGMLGTGDVAQSLGTAFVTLGHEVKMGSRTQGNEKAIAWANAAGPKASTGTFSDAAGFGEIVVLATLGSATESVLQGAGPERLRGKVVIDTTNPLDFSSGAPKLVVPAAGSGGQEVQKLLPGALVVKAFNTVGHGHMFRPELPGGPPDMFICGGDGGAKKKVAELLGQFGWGVVDIGGIDGSGYLEAMCLVWVRFGMLSNTWKHAFKLLRG